MATVSIPACGHRPATNTHTHAHTHTRTHMHTHTHTRTHTHTSTDLINLPHLHSSRPRQHKHSQTARHLLSAIVRLACGSKLSIGPFYRYGLVVSLPWPWTAAHRKTESMQHQPGYYGPFVAVRLTNPHSLCVRDPQSTRPLTSKHVDVSQVVWPEAQGSFLFITGTRSGRCNFWVPHVLFLKVGHGMR